MWSYLVTEELGMVVKHSQNMMKEKGKPYWQRRVKKKHCSMEERSRLIGRIEERDRLGKKDDD